MIDLTLAAKLVSSFSDPRPELRLHGADAVEAVAALPGARRRETLHLASGELPTQVCVGATAAVGGLVIDATHWREATAADRGLPSYHPGRGASATPAETAEALGLPVCPRCREPVEAAGMCAECESAIAIR